MAESLIVFDGMILITFEGFAEHLLCKKHCEQNFKSETSIKNSKNISSKLLNKLSNKVKRNFGSMKYKKL